ncbi:MAG TPA: oligosaccharide flippase family protein [Longimicrobiaceae bacterium]|nr:oligosaccharide flippase family protein [Longimicrobiaceae bacterium]
MGGSAWALLSLTLGIVTSALRAFVVARLLGAHEVGTVGIAMLVLATAEALTTTGSETALVTHPDGGEEDLDLIFTLRVAQGLLIALLLWGAAPVAARFFGVPAVAGLTRALALVPLIRGFSNPAAVLLIRRIEFRRLFWWGLPETVAGIALLVGVGLARRDAWALAAATIGAQGVSTAVSYLMAPRIPRLTVRGPGLARLLHYGRWMQGTRVLMFLGFHLDNLLVGKLLGPTALGYYQLAFRIGEIPVSTVGRAAAQVMLPVLTRLRRRPDRLRRQFLSTLRLVVGVNAAFALVLVLAARPAVELLLGPSWLPAVPVIRILAVAMVFRVVMVLTNQLFYAVERLRLVFMVNTVRVAVMALTIYPLLLAMGISGVAVAVLLSSAATALACVAGAGSVTGFGPGGHVPGANRGAEAGRSARGSTLFDPRLTGGG